MATSTWSRGNGSGKPNRVWLNDGAAAFTDSGQELGNNNSHAVLLGDLDGDGDLDLVEGSSGPNRVLSNDGAGVFVDTGVEIGSGNSQSIALGDLDCDGDLDLVIGGRDPSEAWYNDGDGGFTSNGQLVNAATDSVALGDLDGDGDLDVFAGNFNGQANEVWFLDRERSLSDSGQRLGDASTSQVVLADFDGDGDLDAAGGELRRTERPLAELAFGLLGGARLRRGAGLRRRIDARAGRRRPGPERQLRRDRGRVLVGTLRRAGADRVTRDSRPCRSSTWWRPPRSPWVTWIGTAGSTSCMPTRRRRPWSGPGSRAVCSARPRDRSRTGRCATWSWSTTTGTGLLDVVRALEDADSVEVWRNEGAFQFSALDLQIGTPPAQAVAAGDLDRDGDPDLLLALVGAPILALHQLDDGSLDFAPILGTEDADALALGDLDRDG